MVVISESVIEVNLRKRKNKLQGSKLTRTCWCKKHEGCTLCPIHVLAEWMKLTPDGARPFEGITCARANQALRIFLEAFCRDPCHAKYRTHDLRRGHAEDLRLSGASLYEILRAGEWRSLAFLSYLNQMALEHDVVLQAHVDESSSEDDDC